MEAALRVDDAYMTAFLAASDSLGIEVNKEAVEARPSFYNRMASVSAGLTASEFALHNALGIFLNAQLSNPKPYPNKLHLTIATAYAWVEGGRVSKEFFAHVLGEVQQKLEEQGLKL